MGPSPPHLGVCVVAGGPGHVPSNNSVGKKWPHSLDALEQKSTRSVDRMGGNVLGRDFVGSGSQEICQEISVLGDNWVERGWGLQRHHGGGDTKQGGGMGRVHDLVCYVK